MTTLTGGLSRRRFLQTTAATGVAATLPLSGLRAQPKKGGNLRMGKAHGQTTDTLNPAVWENGFTIAMAFGIHGYLTSIAADGSVEPNVAESWEASSDAKTWRFKIRPGVTFHSGKTVTAEDVIASVDYHRGEESTSAAKPIVEAITNISADGDTVVFELEAGNADFPAILTDYHIPICKAMDGSIDWQSGDGCGPYKLVEFEPGVVARFEKNENDWAAGERGWFDTVEMLSIVDLNARTTALISGDVDVIDRLDLKTVGLLGRRPGININSVAGNQHYTFPMNATVDPFTDNNIRLALKYAINRQELVDKVLFGYGSVGNDHPIGQGQRFYNADLPQTEYDPDKAKFHLKEAGVDGLTVALSASDAAFGGAVDAAVLYQNSASAAGITLDVVREPNDGYWSDVWMKKPWSTSYWSGRPVEDQMFSTAYTTGAAWNESFWSNARFDELLIAARAELDEAKRREMYYEMQMLLNTEGSAVVPMFASYVFATSDKLGHGEFASNWDLDGERWMERWYFA